MGATASPYPLLVLAVWNAHETKTKNTLARLKHRSKTQTNWRSLAKLHLQRFMGQIVKDHHLRLRATHDPIMASKRWWPIMMLPRVWKQANRRNSNMMGSTAVYLYLRSNLWFITWEACLARKTCPQCSSGIIRNHSHASSPLNGPNQLHQRPPLVDHRFQGQKFQWRQTTAVKWHG